MLSLHAISEAAISSMPTGPGYFAVVEVVGGLDVASRTAIVADFGERPVFAVEISLASTVP